MGQGMQPGAGDRIWPDRKLLCPSPPPQTSPPTPHRKGDGVLQTLQTRNQLLVARPEEQARKVFALGGHPPPPKAILSASLTRCWLTPSGNVRILLSGSVSRGVCIRSGESEMMNGDDITHQWWSSCYTYPWKIHFFPWLDTFCLMISRQDFFKKEKFQNIRKWSNSYLKNRIGYVLSNTTGDHLISVFTGFLSSFVTFFHM